MSGVFELNSNSINFVATDAHKLVKYTRNDSSVNENAEFIMPKKPLQLLKNVLLDKEMKLRLNTMKQMLNLVLMTLFLFQD